MIELKKASFEDAHYVTETRRIVWEQTYRGIYPDSMIDGYDYDRYLLKDQTMITSPQHSYYLFMDGNRCIGYFSFGPYNYGTYKDYQLCLNSLYICKEYKGKGLGKQAFSVIRNYCKAYDLSKFFCGCNVHNQPAQSFYKHMGGIAGDISTGHKNRSEDIIYFEFHTGE